MKLNLRNAGEAVVIEVNGRIVLGESDELREVVRTLLDEGKRDLIVDLSDVPYIDSSGLGELVSSYSTVTSRGGRLALAGLTKKIQDLLQVTKLITVFPVYENAAEAVASLQER